MKYKGYFRNEIIYCNFFSLKFILLILCDAKLLIKCYPLQNYNVGILNKFMKITEHLQPYRGKAENPLSPTQLQLWTGSDPQMLSLAH